MKNQKGFTLVEGMIVVAIIGILLAIAIPKFKQMRAKQVAYTEAEAELSGGMREPSEEEIRALVNKKLKAKDSVIDVNLDASEKVFRVKRDYKFVEVKAGHADSFNMYFIVTKKRRGTVQTPPSEYRIYLLGGDFATRQTIRVIEE